MDGWLFYNVAMFTQACFVVSYLAVGDFNQSTSVQIEMMPDISKLGHQSDFICVQIDKIYRIRVGVAQMEECVIQ